MLYTYNNYIMTIKVYVESYGEFSITKNKVPDLITWLQNNSNTSALVGEVIQHNISNNSTVKPQPLNHLFNE